MKNNQENIMEIPDEMIETLLPAVREQLESSETSYVKACFNRLIEREKLEEQDALELIAQVLAIVVNEMMVGGRSFDTARYKNLLKDLPALPDESPL